MVHTININHPRTKQVIPMEYWVNKNLNNSLVHIIMSCKYLAEQKIFHLKQINVRLFEANMFWAEKHRKSFGLGIRYWIFAGLNVGIDIFIHKDLNKYETIAHILHEYCHLIFGDNEKIVHEKAMELCLKIIQNYDKILWTFENKTIAHSVSKGEYEYALRYLNATKDLF